MFCGKCGNKLIEKDDFCRKCGTKIHSENKVDYYIESEENLGIKWFNIYTYFFLPMFLVSFVIRITFFFNDNLQSFDISLLSYMFGLLITVLETIFIVLTFLALIHKKKIGYISNFILLAFTCFLLPYRIIILDNIFETTLWILLYSFILLLVWFYPNFIYFRKRKYLFE